MGMTSTATKLIKRFGQAAVLRKAGGMSGDPWNPDPVPPTDHAVTVAVTQYTVEDMANTLIGTADLRVFMAVADAVPLKSDTLVIGGQSYAIESVSTLGPDGVTICYDLQVRA